MNAEAASNIKFRQYENEIEKKKRDEDKIELMTQFMLDPTSSATKLLEKRREMYELQEALQKDKEKFNEKETQFKKTEEELRNRDEDFHKKICDYYMNTFEKKQNDAHANSEKIKTERKATLEMEEKIANLKTKNEKLKEDLEKLKLIHDKLRAYEDFLKKVKDKHPESFNDLNGVIEKYKILEDKYNEIKKETEMSKKQKEQEKIKFRLEKSELEGKINVLISNIQTIQGELKDLKEKKKDLESEVTMMEANSNTVVSSLEMILLAVDNIYEKCAKKSAWTQHGDLKEFSKYDNNDKDKKKLYQKRVQEAKTKIKYINSYIQDYVKITEDYKKLKKQQTTNK
jgi:FtsZ-binding cell division protein ZapB